MHAHMHTHASFPDPSPSVSHAIVLPQDPSSAPPPGTTPSAIPDPSQDDALDIFGMAPGGGGDMSEYTGSLLFGEK